ncbi:hypothetical protein D3C83_90130 [compost metagenome]
MSGSGPKFWSGTRGRMMSVTIANLSVASTSELSILRARRCSQSLSASIRAIATATQAASCSCPCAHSRPSRNASSAEISVAMPVSPCSEVRT